MLKNPVFPSNMYGKQITLKINKGKVYVSISFCVKRMKQCVILFLIFSKYVDIVLGSLHLLKF